MKAISKTGRTRVKRAPKRGVYEPETIFQILDESFICHVGFIHDGKPVVIPTAYGRVGDRLYLHGSTKSRMLMALKDGVEACITTTIVDGLVLARSIFHHSMNYRSVVIFGRASIVSDDSEKLEALKAFSDHIISGRWEEVRAPNEKELKGTQVISFPITEASAKIRTGPPVDDKADYELPIWAGEIPLHTIAMEAKADPLLPNGLEIPKSVAAYLQGTNR